MKKTLIFVLSWSVFLFLYACQNANTPPTVIPVTSAIPTTPLSDNATPSDAAKAKIETTLAFSARNFNLLETYLAEDVQGMVLESGIKARGKGEVLALLEKELGTEKWNFDQSTSLVKQLRLLREYPDYIWGTTSTGNVLGYKLGDDLLIHFVIKATVAELVSQQVG